MKTIRCQNCGKLVSLNPELQCEFCNSKYYGRQIESFKKEYQHIIDNWNKPSNEIESMRDSPKSAKSAEVNVTQDDKKTSNMDELGWLIVHTEGKDPIHFPLIKGVNFIGRPVPDIKPNIEVPDDIYVSRGHAILCVIEKSGDGWKYLLTDNNSNQRKSKSLNGTHLNGSQNRISENEEVQLKDGDTIQIGETKLVLKTPEIAKDIDEAKTQVLNMDYEKTIFKGNNK